ncbi:nicotinate-nucleotide--dimethylbenzimidazole phosphoribosyltransferase [Synechococcus sp. CS-1328]|nr:nicotinate-nucleotide--dimethylbenzimidazole phosphoribosyltransferase [Synechococcus sp. CS-1328]
MRRLAGQAGVAQLWLEQFTQNCRASEVLLLLAATETAAVPGISAAGATPASRRRTAAADAELLLLGPAAHRPHALPPLPAGVSPALIGHVVLQTLGIDPLVVDLGCPVRPAVPHVRLPGASGPAACLSSGRAMERRRVEQLLELGRTWGRRLGRAPLVIAECVPGGTTTAQAVLTGLGVAAEGLVSGSLHQPAHALKATLVAQGLARAGLEHGPSDPVAVLAAVGDPMQPLAAGLVLGLLQGLGQELGLGLGQGLGQASPSHTAHPPVLLAGGSQMAAVLAIALALTPADQRAHLVDRVALGTTAWVAAEADSDLQELLRRIGARWQVQPLAFASELRFHNCRQRALQDYEHGYVKEGVGAGGLAMLWSLSGGHLEGLAAACDQACGLLLEEGRL